MKLFKSVVLASLSALALTACGGDSGNAGGTRDSIRAVGSSTVYPFAKLVSEQFSRANSGFKSPLIESTGTGGGMQLFCAGVGANTPDITNASRRMKASEFQECQANGVEEIIEIQIGLDGLAFASAQGGIQMNLTPEIVYEALAARPYGEEQTAKTWKDVDSSLPDVPILVYGPPSTSGTRDSLKELILEKGCASNPQMAALKESDEDRHAQICTEVRSDGAYVDQGEQDNLIVQKIKTNPQAVGVFGYSYLEENAEQLQGLPMNGVKPTDETVTSGAYPGAREMYIYAKKAHLDAIPGLKEFLEAWAESIGPGGPLAQIGMIPSTEEQRARSREAALDHTVMTGEDL
jgi:phosphate transport system substrate-binding protein